MMDEQRSEYGLLTFWAVAEAEPVGKPLSECQRVKVRLTLCAPEDLQGSPSQAELRQRRLCRLAQEAVEQGGVLTLEELASILTSSYSTMVRDAASLRRRREIVPTRGQLKDIGRNIESRVEIIRYYSTGETPERIAELTGRTLTDVMRPIKRFKEIKELLERRMSEDRIVKLVGVSLRLLKVYKEIILNTNDSSTAI